MNVDNLEHKCSVWRRLRPGGDQLDFEASLVARDMCESVLSGRGDDTRRLRTMLADADFEVLRLFHETSFSDPQLAELRWVLEDYRRVYYGPLKRHFAPSPERERWWLWLDEIASGGLCKPLPDAGADSRN